MTMWLREESSNFVVVEDIKMFYNTINT